MVYKRSSSIEVKKINKNTIYKYIFDNVKVSKHDIAVKLNMSMPTVLQNIKELSNENLIKESGEFESSGGRKAKAISIIDDAKYSLGIDITKEHISLVLINLYGNIVKHLKLEKRFDYTDDYFIWMNKSIEEFICKIDINKILGAGISIPGIIDKSGKYITSSYVLGIENIECRSFSKYIPLECIFINDANASGFAEARYIDNDALYLSLSNSVGGAIILNKKLHTGDNLRAGEFGHITIEPKGKKCYCGKIGCLDCYVRANLLSDLTNYKLDVFFEELKNGNKKLLKVWKDYLYYLSIAVNNLRMSFDCDIIIGGYVGSYFNEYIEIFREMVSDFNIFEKNADYIKVCRHNFEAAALGAALIHIHNFIEKI